MVITRHPYGQQASTGRMLSKNESGPTCGT